MAEYTVWDRFTRPLGIDARFDGLVAAERQGNNTRQLLEAVALGKGDEV